MALIRYSTAGREITLIWVPLSSYLKEKRLSVPVLQKSSPIVLCWDFVGSFFMRSCPWHHQEAEKQKKLPIGTRCRSSLYSAIDSRRFQNKENGDTVPKQTNKIPNVTLKALLFICLCNYLFHSKTPNMHNLNIYFIR